MARVRVPGGQLTAAQWLALDDIAEERGNGTLRITTRQAIQFHGLIKSNYGPPSTPSTRRCSIPSPLAGRKSQCVPPIPIRARFMRPR